jgi:hypothetical protein
LLALHTARTAAGITTDTDYTADVTDTLDENAATNLNALAAETGGVVTASVSNLTAAQAHIKHKFQFAAPPSP